MSAPPLFYNRPPIPPDIEAEVRLFATAQGGRKHPVFSGYRPIHGLSRPEGLLGALHEYPDAHTLNPAETGRALLWFAASEQHTGRLDAGLEFTIQDGSHVVGWVKILRVLNPALQR